MHWLPPLELRVPHLLLVLKRLVQLWPVLLVPVLLELEVAEVAVTAAAVVVVVVETVTVFEMFVVLVLAPVFGFVNLQQIQIHLLVLHLVEVGGFD
jgi:hypothetical protein